MRKILFFLLLIAFSTTSFCEKKLIFSTDLIRHGYRNPVKEIPSSPYPWKEGLGELTPEGMNQEYQLGVALRKKYVEQYHLLPINYNAKAMCVRSTDLNRTLMSAESFLLGFQPLQSGATLEKSQQFSLPQGFQPIPIHTVSASQDKLLFVKPSSNIFSMVSLFFATHHAWNEKTALIKDKLKRWSKATGMKINNFRQLGYLADNLYIRKMNQLPLPTGISQKDAAQIISLAEWAMVEAFKRKEITQPMGHEFLSTVANYMKEVVHYKTFLKYALFFGHDSSVMAVMNTLGSPLDKIPFYASDLNFSLWEDENQYYVEVTLNNDPVIVPGCNGNICSLTQFYKIAAG